MGRLAVYATLDSLRNWIMEREVIHNPESYIHLQVPAFAAWRPKTMMHVCSIAGPQGKPALKLAGSLLVPSEKLGKCALRLLLLSNSMVYRRRSQVVQCVV